MKFINQNQRVRKGYLKEKKYRKGGIALNFHKPKGEGDFQISMKIIPEELLKKIRKRRPLKSHGVLVVREMGRFFRLSQEIGFSDTEKNEEISGKYFYGANSLQLCFDIIPLIKYISPIIFLVSYEVKRKKNYNIFADININGIKCY